MQQRAPIILFEKQLANLFVPVSRVYVIDVLPEKRQFVIDLDESGLPVVTNGMAMCTIRHRAYGQNFLGASPDYVVHLNERMLADREHLAERFAAFTNLLTGYS